MAGAFQLLPSVPTTARSLLRFAAAKSISRSLLPLSRARNAEARLQSSLSGGEAKTGTPLEQSEIIFLGTGTSEGIPRVSCLTNQLKRCTVCSKATEPGNKNRRHNTSILLRYASSLGIHNILVDAGKYTESIKQCQITAVLALKDLPLVDLPAKEKLTLMLRTIDSVIITHSHADAIGGLDDLRDWTNNVQPYIPIYVTARDLEENKMHMEHPFMLLITDQLFIFYEHKVMKKTHYYLVDTSVVLPGAAVSELQFNIINEEPFIVHNLKVIPLPVWHGNGYRSLGFRFGDVCYISDVSDIPEETYKLLRNCELLILDGLRPDRSSSTHFGLPRALEEVRKIKPKRTLFTGMMHLMDHDKVNEDLAKLMETEGLDAQLSYDGLRVPINL